jgi:hypothetical protein
MVDLQIFRPAAEMPGQRQEPAVFAGTVIVPLIRRPIGTDHRVGRVLVRRHLRPAAQIAFAKPEFREPFTHHVGMDRRALVRGAGQREALFRQAGRIRRAAFHKRQCLDHLDCAARQDAAAAIAPARDQADVVMPDRDMTPVHAFHKRIADDAHKLRRVGPFCHRYAPPRPGLRPVAIFRFGTFAAVCDPVLFHR